MIALVIVSQSCFLWCALATRYILRLEVLKYNVHALFFYFIDCFCSLSDQLCESELDDVIQSLEEQQVIFSIS